MGRDRNFKIFLETIKIFLESVGSPRNKGRFGRFVDEPCRSTLRPPRSIDGSDRCRLRPPRSIDGSDRCSLRPLRSIDGSDRYRLRPLRSIDGSDRCSFRPLRSIDGFDRCSLQPLRSIDGSDRCSLQPLRSIDGFDRCWLQLPKSVDGPGRSSLRPREVFRLDPPRAVHRPWLSRAQHEEPQSGQRIFRRYRGLYDTVFASTACRPWLSSYAAPRLKPNANETTTGRRDVGRRPCKTTH
jgi:hypothetical protein